MLPTPIRADIAYGDPSLDVIGTVRQPLMIRPGDLFTVEGRPYRTFEFGTNDDSAMSRGVSRWPRTADDIANVPWAFPHASVIASTPQEKPQHRFALQEGSTVLVAGYGWYRLTLKRCNPDNVRFEAVS